MNLKNLSNTDIIQLQYNLLEELKQKITNQDTSLSFDVNKDIQNISTTNDYEDESNLYEEFILQRFSDPLGNTENTKEYYARISWFNNSCPTYRKLSELIGYTPQMIGNYAYKYNWTKIKEQAFDLGYRLGGKCKVAVEEFIDNTEKEITRNSPEYYRYREKVLKRDIVCQCCGDKDNLEVHHPLPYNQYPSLRADINNGIVLCEECHADYHNMNGYKRNANPITLSQFLRDYGESTQSKLVEEDIIINNFVRKLFVIPSTLIERLDSQKNNIGLKNMDVVENRWSIQVGDKNYDTYVKLSTVRNMFSEYVSYLNKEKRGPISLPYNTHKVKQAMEHHGFKAIAKNITNEDGGRSTIRVWDKCMVNHHNYDKIKGVI